MPAPRSKRGQIGLRDLLWRLIDLQVTLIIATKLLSMQSDLVSLSLTMALPKALGSASARGEFSPIDLQVTLIITTKLIYRTGNTSSLVILTDSSLPRYSIQPYFVVRETENAAAGDDRPNFAPGPIASAM
jgi:hypothetical protein